MEIVHTLEQGRRRAMRRTWGELTPEMQAALEYLAPDYPTHPEWLARRHQIRASTLSALARRGLAQCTLFRAPLKTAVPLWTRTSLGDAVAMAALPAEARR